MSIQTNGSTFKILPNSKTLEIPENNHLEQDNIIVCQSSPQTRISQKAQTTEMPW